MINFKKDWHFNMLGVYNYNKEGSFSNLISFIKNNHSKLAGDIVEAGVYKGHSLIAIAKLLKDLGSDKKVYGFDTFTGFPPVYHEKDNLPEFLNMHQEGLISKEHFESVQLNQMLLERFSNKNFDQNTKNISSSGEFEDNNLRLLKNKIEYLELDNIELIQGEFSETMTASQEIKSIMAAVIDCDLYESYLVSLDFVWKKLVPGGFVHLDEYYSLKFPGARRATLEFLNDKSDVSLNKKSLEEDFERWYIIKKDK